MKKYYCSNTKRHSISFTEKWEYSIEILNMFVRSKLFVFICVDNCKQTHESVFYSN